jgi:hypothetical protein
LPGLDVRYKIIYTSMLSGDDKWFAVSLRFMGTGFNPRDVEGRIGLPPTSMRVIGEKWTGKTGREYGPAKNNVWSHRLEAADDLGFELQIRTLLDRIAAHSDAVRTLAGKDQVEAELFCGFGSGNGQGGDIISADTLGQVAALGLALSLDLYPPDIDDHPEESESDQAVRCNRRQRLSLNSGSPPPVHPL